MSCVPYVTSFSGLYFFIAPSVFSNIYLSCVLYTLCCQFLWIVLFYCPFGILKHVFVLCLVYPMLPVSGLFFFIAPSVFSNIYLSCVLCTLCCQFLWIVLFSLPLRYSLTFICPVSCVPYVASFSGLSFFIAPSVFSNIYLSLCLVYPMLPVTLDCTFLLPLRYSLTFIYPVSCVPYVASFSGLSFFIAPSVFFNIYLPCVLCTLCCQFL